MELVGGTRFQPAGSSHSSALGTGFGGDVLFTAAGLGVGLSATAAGLGSSFGVSFWQAAARRESPRSAGVKTAPVARRGCLVREGCCIGPPYSQPLAE